VARPGIRNEVEVQECHLPPQRTRYRGRESTWSIVALFYEVFLLLHPAARALEYFRIHQERSYEAYALRLPGEIATHLWDC
jgi:hypothetical protein